MSWWQCRTAVWTCLSLLVNFLNTNVLSLTKHTKVTGHQIGTVQWMLSDFPSKTVKQTMCCVYTCKALHCHARSQYLCLQWIFILMKCFAHKKCTVLHTSLLHYSKFPADASFILALCNNDYHYLNEITTVGSCGTRLSLNYQSAQASFLFFNAITWLWNKCNLLFTGLLYINSWLNTSICKRKSIHNYKNVYWWDAYWFHKFNLLHWYTKFYKIQTVHTSKNCINNHIWFVVEIYLTRGSEPWWESNNLCTAVESVFNDIWTRGKGQMLYCSSHPSDDETWKWTSQYGFSIMLHSYKKEKI